MTIPTLEAINLADGDRVVRAFLYDKALHPTEAIQTLRSLAINNIKARKVKTVILKDYVDYAFEVYAIMADIKGDDKNFLDGKDDPKQSMPWARVQLNILHRNKVEQPLQFYFSNYVQYSSKLIIAQNRTLEIESDKDINNVRLFIKPINLEQEIDVP